MKSIFSLGVRV